MDVAASTAVTFAQETLASCLAEMQPLLEKHWREITSYLDIPLSPDYDRYRQLEAADALRIYTVRTDTAAVDGAKVAIHFHVLIGYAVFFLAPHLHYTSSLQAYGDVLFLDPEFRRGTTAYQLIRFADRALAAEHVQVVRHHVKVAHPALGVILSRLGYAHTEDNYEKRLD